MVVVLAGGFALSHSALARGDDEGENDRGSRNQQINTQSNDENEDGLDDGEQDDDNLNEHVSNWITTDLTPSTTTLAPGSVQTYADVRSVLVANQQTVTALMVAANATTTLGANLSAGEANLLTALIAKYRSTFSTINVRGTEINAQLAVVIGALQPLGDGPIAPVLKKIIVSVLTDFADEVKNLGELARQSVGVLTAETAPAAIVTPAPVSAGASTFTMAQVSAANSAAKCWTAINGAVYNLTAWIAQHPGGSQAILGICGKDGTAAFMGQHGGQSNPTRVLTGYKIGLLQ